MQKIQNKNTQKLKDTFKKKKNQQIVQRFFVLFFSVEPMVSFGGDDWELRWILGMQTNSKLGSRYRYPLYELWMHLPRGVYADFHTARIEARWGLLEVSKCQNDKKLHFHLVPNVPLFWPYILVLKNSIYLLFGELLYSCF